VRVLLATFACALVVLQYRLWLSDDGMREVWRLRQEVVERTEENRMQAARNAALEAEVQDLKQGLAAVEERARTELGMIGPKETFFQIVPAE